MSVLRSFLSRERPLLGVRWLVAMALVGVVAAIGYALGPVDQGTFVYTYRPADAATTANPAIAPLPLARPTPDALRLSLPCEVDRPASGFRSMDLADWKTSDGLWQSPLTYPISGWSLSVFVGDGSATILWPGNEIQRLPVEHGPGCMVQVTYENGMWRMSVGDQEWVAESQGPRIIEAQFDGPAASSSLSAITVATRELGSSPTLIQHLLLLVAIGSLLVVGREVVVRTASSDPNRPERERLLKRVFASLGAVDVGVIVSLIVWLLIIPAGFDDGWIAARVEAFDTHGAFSNLFDTDAAVMPFGYWLEWLQRFLPGLGSTPVLMRVPILLIGLGTWAGLRSMARLFGIPGRGGSLWLMGAVFVVGYGAWGMTLRAEPVIAALMIASLALALRFVRGERGWVLFVWVAVMALAVTAHPAGLIALAPLIGAWRSVWEWMRSNREAAYVRFVWLLMLGTATMLLFFFDSNLDTKLESVESFRLRSHDLSVADELLRYRLLNSTPYATVMRRLSVALIFVGVGSFVLRRRDHENRTINLPARTLIISLALLSLTPSKWPWHFGGLLALVALVVAMELRRAAPDLSGGDSVGARGTAVMRMVAVMAGAAVVMAWAWSVSLPWTMFDLRTREWWTGDAAFLPMGPSSYVAWVGIAVVVGVTVTVFRRWRRASRMWNPPEALTMVSVVLVIVMTASTLVLDVLGTDGWTFGRQNIDAALGRGDCGLGDVVDVPIPGSLHALDSANEVSSLEADQAATSAGFRGSALFEQGGFPRSGVNAIRPLLGMDDVGSWVVAEGRLAEENTGSYRSGWYVIEPDDDTVVLMMMGLYDDAGSESGNAVALQWGAAGDTDIADLGVQLAPVMGYYLDWLLVTFTPPASADRIRLLARDDSTRGAEAWIATSLPLALSTAPISAVAKVSDILVTPPLMLYFPCVGVPPIERSVAKVPGMIIQTWPALWQHSYAAAVASDRQFQWVVEIPPGQDESVRIGAHTGELGDFLFVSQEYLTGDHSRATGEFVLEQG